MSGTTRVKDLSWRDSYMKCLSDRVVRNVPHSGSCCELTFRVIFHKRLSTDNRLMRSSVLLTCCRRGRTGTVGHTSVHSDRGPRASCIATQKCFTAARSRVIFGVQFLPETQTASKKGQNLRVRTRRPGPAARATTDTLDSAVHGLLRLAASSARAGKCSRFRSSRHQSR